MRTFQKSAHPKHRHHYVWRQYLRAWAKSEKIWCLTNRATANPNLMNIAQERDFYKFRHLDQADIDFVRKLVVEQAIPGLRPLHERTLNQYLNAQHALVKSESTCGQIESIDHAAKILECNYLEDWHTEIEARAIIHLACLQEGDATFYQNSDACIDFATFMAAQHLRTQKHRDAVVHPKSPIDPNRIRRTWPLVSQMLVTNIAWFMYANRHEQPLRVIHNATGTSFLIADQPVLNTLANPEAPDTPPTHSALYYPVSPAKAILIGNDLEIGNSLHIQASTQLVRSLNRRVIANAHRHVFAETEEELLIA
ncbi:DUF4238 domain-containing protein [Pseudacidovorax sp. NFM-22]|uniref:DUF4238 domain-containing protein n=1 Tax=Pseudacidovorax sp. NFM-22 TaxID=2744469 RepID=UPI001F198BB8|nr:DUF4238 domain-containing protein [Pseudacidovorax sp. NFM-22]